MEISIKLAPFEAGSIGTALVQPLWDILLKSSSSVCFLTVFVERQELLCFRSLVDTVLNRAGFVAGVELLWFTISL